MMMIKVMMNIIIIINFSFLYKNITTFKYKIHTSVTHIFRWYTTTSI